MVKIVYLKHCLVKVKAASDKLGIGGSHL
jgi:hypothetical protein